MSGGIYIASKTIHADRWRMCRDRLGFPIISTWIDEAGANETGDWNDLWSRCIREASSASALIVYRGAASEVLKGAWIEVGAALSANVPVFAVGVDEFSISKSGLIQRCATMGEAWKTARLLASCRP